VATLNKIINNPLQMCKVKFLLENSLQAGVVPHAYPPSPLESEAGGLGVQGQPWARWQDLVSIFKKIINK
jgi:hypothetical protein